jgi:hypothetical protein
MRWAVRASTALFGLTAGIAVAPAMQFRAHPADPLSALKLEGLSPLGPVVQFLTAVLLAALFAIAGDRVSRLLDGHRWAEIAYCSALLLAPITLMSFGNWRHVALLGVAAAAIVAIRNRDPQFTKQDVLLVPAFLSCCMAFYDLGFGHTPVATVSRAAVAILGLRVLVRNPAAFLATPLALVFQLGWLRQEEAGVLALVVLFAAPPLLARTRIDSGRERTLRRRLIYPLIVFLYPLAVLHGNPLYRIDFFEDSHNIPVAAEMLRGERPYRDIVPTHGLISDGLVDLAGLKLGGGSLRMVFMVRMVAGVSSAVAIYCLTLAATGDAEVALLGTFLAFLLTSGSAIWLRPSAALFALAATVAATRLRSRRFFTVAGALVVLAWLTSMDFGLYSAVVAIFAAIRSRALTWLVIGVACAAIPLLAVFAIFGFALDFLRSTFGEILGNHGAYFLQPLELPDCLRSPALLHHIGSDTCLYAFTWIIALIASCAALARSPLRARRSDAPWLIGVWIVVAAASFVERGNFHFVAAVTPFIVVALWTLSKYARTAAAILTAAVIVLAQPLRHVTTVIPEVRAARPLPLFDSVSESSVKAARRFAATLRPNETFVDFTNSALIYPLVGRDCPLRYVEVANYQSAEGQHEVIAGIERNREIRAALIVFPGSNADVDGIPNSRRAPLVWSYLQQHFVPAFTQDGVVFWRRAS